MDSSEPGTNVLGHDMIKCLNNLPYLHVLILHNILLYFLGYFSNSAGHLESKKYLDSLFLTQ